MDGGKQRLPVEFVGPPLPSRIQRWRPRVRLSVVIVRICRVPNPCDSIVRSSPRNSGEKRNIRTKTTERISVGELRPVFRRHRRTVPTGDEALGWFRGRVGVIPSVVRSVSLSVIPATDARVILGFDHCKVNRQDHGKHNRHDDSGRSKPECGSPGQGPAMFGLGFDDIPFEVLFGFRDQRGSPRRSQRVSRRRLKRREVEQGGWKLEQSIVLAGRAE